MPDQAHPSSQSDARDETPPVRQQISRIESGGVAVGVVEVDKDGVANIGGQHYHTRIEARKSGYVYAGVPPMVKRFLGRETLVGALVDALTGGDAQAVAVHGLPGVGKTSLAVALAHHTGLLAHFSGGVLWGGLGRTSNVAAVQALWGGALGVGVNLEKLAQTSQRRKLLTSFVAELGKPVLLVLDDAWQLDAAQDLQLGAPNVVHLLTTRDWGLAQAFADPDPARRIPELAEDPSYALLRLLAPEAWAHDPDAARALADSTGGLPLALELVGGYLAAPQRTLLPGLTDKAFAELADPAARLALACRRLGGSGGQQSLAEAIRLSVDDLAELSPGAAAAFYALGAFAPKPARFDLDAAQAVADADAETLALLAVRSLLEIDETGSAAIHQVVADFARTQTPTEAIARHLEYYLNLVNQTPEDWQAIEAIYPQVRFACDAATDRVAFVDALETYQTRRGLWEDRLGWLAEALVQARNARDQYTEARILHNYGYVYARLGEKKEALAYYNQALPLLRKVGNEESQAATLSNLGVIYGDLGKGKKALARFNQALSLFRRAEHKTGQAATLHNIGGIYASQGNGKKALTYYNQALALTRQINDKGDEAIIRNSIGGVYVNLGDRKRALAYFNQALALSRQMGDKGREAISLHNIGGVYDNQGEKKKALTYFNQSLTLFRQVGDRVGEVANRWAQGLLYAKEGDLTQAEKHLHTAIDIANAIQSPDVIAIEQTLTAIRDRQTGGRDTGSRDIGRAVVKEDL